MHALQFLFVLVVADLLDLRLLLAVSVRLRGNRRTDALPIETYKVLRSKLTHKATDCLLYTSPSPRDRG